MSQSVYLLGPAGAKSSKSSQVKKCGRYGSWGEQALSYMTPVSGDATSTGVEEAIYADAGATGKKYLSQFRGWVSPASSGSSHRSP